MGPTVKLKARRGHQRRRESLGHSCRFRIKSSLFAKQRIGTVARRCFDQISPDSERCHQKSLLRSAAFSRRDPERGLQTRLSARSSGSVESPRSGGGSNSELSHVRPRKGNQPSLAGRYFVCGHTYACGGRTQTPKHPPIPIHRDVRLWRHEKIGTDAIVSLLAAGTLLKSGCLPAMIVDSNERKK
jgi:hypothetical protein